MRIAVMQGRLLPPEPGRFQAFPCTRWREEFPSAAAAGVDAIEWIYDLYGMNANPVATDSGIGEMNELSAQTGVAVVSLCADYFMDRPFTTASPEAFAELSDHLRWLWGRSKMAGIGRIVLPFVDASKIETAEQRERIVGLLREVLPWAAECGVELHLETSMDPTALAGFLAELPHPFLKANYDSGNSSSLGYDVREELAAYGERIGSVHIKDRLRGGCTVPLGSGDADLPALLEGLLALGYGGDYVLQVAREAPNNEVAWTRANREFLVAGLDRARALASWSAR